LIFLLSVPVVLLPWSAIVSPPLVASIVSVSVVSPVSLVIFAGLGSVSRSLGVPAFAPSLGTPILGRERGFNRRVFFFVLVFIGVLWGFDLGA
jgi:MFS-type transporter involved in bile tolerance (Atg22 family)